MDDATTARPGLSDFGAPRFAVVLAAFILASSGCSDLLGTGEDRVESNFDTWRAERPALYQFTYQRVCFCPGTEPVVISVDGDSVINVSVKDGDGPPAGALSDYPTIESLFEQLREWRDRDPYREEMEFHDRLGYPTDVFFDFEERVADEEQGFRVRDLRPLEPLTG